MALLQELIDEILCFLVAWVGLSAPQRETYPCIKENKGIINIIVPRFIRTSGISFGNSLVGASKK